MTVRTTFVLIFSLVSVFGSGCYGQKALRQPVTVEEIAADVEEIRSTQSELNHEMAAIESKLEAQAERVADLQAENQFLWEELQQRLTSIDAKLQDAIGRSSGYSSRGPYWSGSGYEDEPNSSSGRDGDEPAYREYESPGDVEEDWSDDDWRDEARERYGQDDEAGSDASSRDGSARSDKGGRGGGSEGGYNDPSASQEEIQAKRVYDQAYLDYSRGNYSLAILGFTEFLRRSPFTELSDNAQYWIAECYYAQHDYRQARVEYQTLLREHPNGDRVPGALLKIGFCSLELNDDAQAREYLTQVTDQYPDSEESKVARDKLRSID